jgi:hypothetical protein
MRWKPYAGVTEGHKNLLVFSSLGLDDQLSYSINVLHRFDAVDDQIHRDLLQWHAISDHQKKIGCQFRSDQYVVSHGLVAQEGNGLSNNLVYIKSLSLHPDFMAASYKVCKVGFECNVPAKDVGGFIAEAAASYQSNPSVGIKLLEHTVDRISELWAETKKAAW